MVFENKLATLVITINTQPLDAIVCAGATATFTTAASGTTNITYQWQFGPTSAGPFIDISNGGGYSGTSTSTLSVNTAFIGKRYRCNVGDFASIPHDC